MRATVDTWFEAGYPGWIFVHFSFIEANGYKALVPGELVEIEGVEPYGHDGCRWLARRVRPLR